MKKNKICYSLFLFLIISLPGASEAKISIKDEWDISGKLFLEDKDWAGVFSKEEGALRVYSKLERTKSEGMKIVPFDSREVKADAIISCKVVVDEEKETQVTVSFSSGKNRISGDFIFAPKGTIHIKPSPEMKGVCIFSPIEYGVVPSRSLTDNIYDPKDYSSKMIYLPSENIFIGLLKGADRILVCAWPEGEQKVRLCLEDKIIKAVEVELDKKDIYLGILCASGIWHKEEPTPSYLEKEIGIEWERPFSAKWKTQLLEGGEFEMPYLFKNEKTKTWRPQYGWYEWPVWFKGEKAFFQLSKNAVSSGEVLIYALEGHGKTPVEFTKNCVGTIPAFEELKISSNYGYPPDHIVMNWCPMRDLLNKIFKEAKGGIQIREREFLKDVIDDTVENFVVIKERFEEFDKFILKMEERIDSWSKDEKAQPELQSFFSDTKNHLEELKRGYENTKQGLTTQEIFQHDMSEVAGKSEKIFEDNSSELLYPAVNYYLRDVKLWDLHHNGGRIFGAEAIKWHQQAGYACAENSAVLRYAEEIRKNIRELKIGSWTYESTYE